jgi:hypothetical protein
MTRAMEGKPASQMVQTFEEAFAAMWRRAEVTLGEVTLVAIVDRVLHDTVAAFPILAPLRVNPNAGAVDFAPLRERAAAMDGDRLRDGLEFVLARFLGVLGDLTADILTRALHAELARLSPAADDRKKR